MLLGLMGMLLYIHIFKTNNGVTTDLLGLKVPTPPLWMSRIPAGGFLGWIYELFSLHGIVSIFILLIPSYIGGLFIVYEPVDASADNLNLIRRRHTGNNKTYLVGGIRKGINEGKPYYGQGAKLLEETKDGWKIIISPMQSEFLQEPKKVDEKTFIDLMLSLGVPNNKLYEFINYEIDWENF